MSEAVSVTIPSAETKVTSGELTAVEKLTKGRAFTAYAVTINQSRVVWRRFSEFVDLDQRLKACVGADEHKLMPRLPEKSFFQTNDFAPELIAKRRVALEAYLKYLVAKGYLQRSSDLLAFLALDAPLSAAFKTSESRDELGESSAAALDAAALLNNNDNGGDADADDDDGGGAWISSIGESISMKSALCSIFVGLEPDKARVYITPNIPLDKFKNAKNSTKMPPDERPVVLVDLSRGGLCHQALLFCTRGVYFHYQGLPADIGSGHFDYPALFRERLRVEGSDLHIGATKLIYLKYAGINAEALFELLKNLREFVRMKQLALRLNEEEPLRPHACRHGRHEHRGGAGEHRRGPAVAARRRRAQQRAARRALPQGARHRRRRGARARRDRGHVGVGAAAGV